MIVEKYKRNVLIPLGVLMWKYAIMRAHRYIFSIMEIWAGVLVFVILFVISQSLRPGNASIYDHRWIDNPNIHFPVTKVYYTPYNNVTKKLMSKVGYYLMNNKSDLIPNMQWEFARLPKHINKDMLNASDGIAVVKFKHFRSLPHDLNYSISVRDRTQGLNAPFNGFLRSDMIEEQSAPVFLGPLLWAIDKSYIDAVTNENVGGFENVRLQPVREYLTWEMAMVHRFMILCTTVAPLPFFLIHSTRLNIERRSGLRELMKLSGISCNVLRFSHFLEAIVVATLYGVPVTTLLKITDWPIIPYSSVLILGLTIIFHFVNLASLAAVTTAITQDFHHAESLGLMVYVFTFAIDFLWYSNTEHRIAIYFFCCILPHAPMYMFWDEVKYLESIGVGSQFWNMEFIHSNNSMSVLAVWFFFVVQQTLISFMAWYLDNVRPGRYGVSKKWNFIFKLPYWYASKPYHVNFDVSAIQSKKEVKRDEKYFERTVRKAEVAIKVFDVTKVFKTRGRPEVTALDSVSFDCYRGEITMLLGTTGAGKTTLMSIVTGMFSATKGTVFIKGKDVAHRILELREDLGLCTRNNLTFRYLTVKENIRFFHMLKRRSREGFTVEQLMKKLKLADKANCFSNELSAGMRRCLQVACTLAGGAEVLVLDEPTTGMEVEVRHHLWDLLMVLRGNKTILMTTTILEEANALGDRIVILNNGKLKCHGTPMFLKHAIGTSFNLSVTINDSTQMRNVKNIVDRIIPNAKFRVHDIRHITFSLPSKDYYKFSRLFRNLEMNQKAYGITLIDVGLFLEEVFLEFIEQEETKPMIIHTHDTYRHIRMERVRGFALILRRMKVLIMRVVLYSWLKKYQFLFLRVITPLICIIIVTLTTNQKLGTDKMFGGTYKEEMSSLHALVYNDGSFSRRGLFNILDKYPGVKPVRSLDIESDLSDPSLGNGVKNTVGLEITNNYSRIFYSSNPHITTKSISLFSNVYMSIHMPYLNNSIRTIYEPMTYYYDERKHHRVKARLPKGYFLCMKWALWVVIISAFPIAPLIVLCISELSTGTRDNHMMAGCSPIVHWLSKLLAHFAQYMIIIPFPVVFFAFLLDFDHTFNQKGFLGSLLVLLLAYGPAFLVYLYFLSFILQENYAVCQLYLLSIFCGCILPVMMSALEPEPDDPMHYAVLHTIALIICRLSPLFPFGYGLGRLTITARFNSFCKLNKRHCPLWFDDTPMFDSDVCCSSDEKEPFKYLTSRDTGLIDLINLIVLFFFYSALVILLENRVLHYIVEQIIFCCYKQPAQVLDANLKKEKEYVRAALENRYYRTDVLIADNLHKDFVRGIRRKDKENSVKGVSFTVKLGDCIAILGPAGAGKSSLLKMLAGSQVMTRGNSCVMGNFIRNDRSKYIHKISLASSGGMDLFMTGRQNLVFIAKLQGYSEEMANKLSLMALRFMGLRDTTTQVAQYSNSGLRRLSLCSTLVLAPPVALLDEPMTDLDANTKPLVAKALMRLMLEPAAVVVSEASVDWRQMQTVFTRMAIMMNGKLTTIGQAEEVLAVLAKGYTARIKLKVVTAYREDRFKILEEEYDYSSDSEEDNAALHSQKSVMYAQNVVCFKKEFQKTFETSRLTAEHLCMLYYSIQDDAKKMLYSDMFRKLEKLKRMFNDVVEDYTLNSTTMEDVFWRLQYEKQSDNQSATTTDNESEIEISMIKQDSDSTESNDLIDPKEPKDPKDQKYLKDPKDPKDPIDPIDPKDLKDANDLQNLQEPRELHDTEESLDSKSSKDRKDPIDPKYSKDPEDPKDPKDPKDAEDPKDPKDRRDGQNSKNTK